MKTENEIHKPGYNRQWRPVRAGTYNDSTPPEFLLTDVTPSVDHFTHLIRTVDTVRSYSYGSVKSGWYLDQQGTLQFFGLYNYQGTLSNNQSIFENTYGYNTFPKQENVTYPKLTLQSVKISLSYSTFRYDNDLNNPNLSNGLTYYGLDIQDFIRNTPGMKDLGNGNVPEYLYEDLSLGKNISYTHNGVYRGSLKIKDPYNFKPTGSDDFSTWENQPPYLVTNIDRTLIKRIPLRQYGWGITTDNPNGVILTYNVSDATINVEGNIQLIKEGLLIDKVTANNRCRYNPNYNQGESIIIDKLFPYINDSSIIESKLKMTNTPLGVSYENGAYNNITYMEGLSRLSTSGHLPNMGREVNAGDTAIHVTLGNYDMVPPYINALDKTLYQQGMVKIRYVPQVTISSNPKDIGVTTRKWGTVSDSSLPDTVKAFKKAFTIGSNSKTTGRPEVYKKLQNGHYVSNIEAVGKWNEIVDIDPVASIHSPDTVYVMRERPLWYQDNFIEQMTIQANELEYGTYARKIHIPNLTIPIANNMLVKIPVNTIIYPNTIYPNALLANKNEDDLISHQITYPSLRRDINTALVDEDVFMPTAVVPINDGYIDENGITNGDVYVIDGNSVQTGPILIKRITNGTQLERRTWPTTNRQYWAYPEDRLVAEDCDKRWTWSEIKWLMRHYYPLACESKHVIGKMRHSNFFSRISWSPEWIEIRDFFYEEMVFAKWENWAGNSILYFNRNNPNQLQTLGNIKVYNTFNVATNLFLSNGSNVVSYRLPIRLRDHSDRMYSLIANPSGYGFMSESNIRNNEPHLLTRYGRDSYYYRTFTTPPSISDL